MEVKFKKGLLNNMPVEVQNGNIYAISDSKEMYVDVNDTRIGLQSKLVSGTNIKTINNQSLLGSGNIEIQGSADLVLENAKTTGGIGWTSQTPASISWDGDTTGKTQLEQYYLISSSVTPESADVVGGTLTYTDGTETESFTITQEMISEIVPGLYQAGNRTASIIVATSTVDVGGGLIIEKGTWFMKYNGVYVSFLSYNQSVKHPISTNYLNLASAAAPGLIKVGTGLSIADDGTLSVNIYNGEVQS